MTKVIFYPVYLFCLWISAKDPAVREALARDAACYGQNHLDRRHSAAEQRRFLRAASSQRTFRTIAYYRAPTPLMRRAAQLLSVFAPGAPAMEIYDTEVGGGLKIRHGNGTVIRAESLGRDCEVYQQVTVGHGRGGFPVIGDRVDLCAGAVVFGGIRVGDDVIIGAGAVVAKDVPDRAIMVGNPARQVGTTDGLRAAEIAWATSSDREAAAPATSSDRKTAAPATSYDREITAARSL